MPATVPPMKIPFRAALIAIFSSALMAAPAVRLPVVSNSSVTVSGNAAGGSSRTIALPFMNNYNDKGNWYVTPSDAHAAFVVADAQPTKQASLNIDLNGKQTTFVINRDNNQDTGRKSDLLFGLNLAGLPYTLDEGDSVTVNVSKMDSLNLEATFSGSLTQAGLTSTRGHDAYRIEIRGVISLHRPAAPAETSAGSYVDCDPIIHDWLNQAEDRAPSDCEVKFDQLARGVFAKAFAPMISSFEAKNWQLKKNLNSASLTAVPRGSEKMPYQFGFAPGGDVSIQLRMDSANVDYQRLQSARQTPDPSFTKMMELIKQGKYAEAQALADQRKPTSSSAAVQDNTQISVQPSLNTLSISVVNLHGSFSSSVLAGGGGVVLFVPEAQPNTGGSEGSATTYVLLGAWGQPNSTALDADSSKVSAKANTSPALSRLSAQTVVVTFRCSRELAQKAIQAVDWNALRGLMVR